MVGVVIYSTALFLLRDNSDQLSYVFVFALVPCSGLCRNGAWYEPLTWASIFSLLLIFAFLAGITECDARLSTTSHLRHAGGPILLQRCLRRCRDGDSLYLSSIDRGGVSSSWVAVWSARPTSSGRRTPEVATTLSSYSSSCWVWSPWPLGGDPSELAWFCS